MYNDFPIISESEILKLKNAYNEKLNRAKSLNLEDNFLKRFNQIILCLKNTLHYLENLINLSKNLEDKNLLKEIQNAVLINLKNIENLYEINESEELIEISNKDNNNFNSNVQSANFYMVCFLEEMFYLLEYENNIKIKNVLSSVFVSALEQIKKLNSLIKTNNLLKVFSLFKRY